jgi:hypothetical protein
MSDIALLLGAYKQLLREKKNHSEHFLRSMEIIQDNNADIELHSPINDAQ